MSPITTRAPASAKVVARLPPDARGRAGHDCDTACQAETVHQCHLALPIFVGSSGQIEFD